MEAWEKMNDNKSSQTLPIAPEIIERSIENYQMLLNLYKES
jgi:hypothetical protein